MEVIFEGNSNTAHYGQALADFKRAVRSFGGQVNDYGMGVPGVDATLKINHERQDVILGALRYEGYTIACSSNGSSVSITPPSRLEDNQSNVASWPRPPVRVLRRGLH